MLIFILIFIFFLLLFVDWKIGDEKIFLIVNQKLSHPFFDKILLYFLCPLFLLLGILPLIFLFKKNLKRVSFLALISGALAYLLGTFLKLLIQRERPFEILPSHLVGPWQTETFSFPSTTTALAFGLSLPFLLEKKKWGLFATFLSLLVGFSVIYAGYHFLLDVIAGFFLALLIVILLKKLI